VNLIIVEPAFELADNKKDKKKLIMNNYRLGKKSKIDIVVFLNEIV